MKPYRPCVSIVLLKVGKNGIEVLLVHKPRKNDAWQIPQGGVEEGESLEEAARRELKEETGIEITGMLRFTGHHYQYDYPPAFIKHQKPKYAGQHLTFLIAVVPEEITVCVDQRELDAYAWVPPTDLRTHLKRKEYRDIVSKIIEEFERRI